MNTRKTILSKTIMIILFCMPLVLSAQKELQIAYVEEVKLLKNLDGYVEQMQTLDSLKQAYEKDLKEKNEKLNLKFQSLLADYKLNDNETVANIEAQLKEEDKGKFSLYIEENELLSKVSDNYNTMLETRYEQRIQPLISKLNAIINEYAKKNKIKIVHKLESLNVAYIDDKINITDNILKLLNKSGL